MVFLILNQQNWIDSVIEFVHISKYVLAALGFFSLISWAVIFDRAWLLMGLKRQNLKIREFYNHSQDVVSLFRLAEAGRGGNFYRIIQAASDEAMRLKLDFGVPVKLSDVEVEMMVRSMKRAISEEIVQMERNLTFLATTASASPYLGLFGTVWGVMESFRSIGVQGSASLAVVAPGISEALIATAAGLAAAIPAVMAYNFFVNKVKFMTVDMQNFMSDVINALCRASRPS